MKIFSWVNEKTHVKLSRLTRIAHYILVITTDFPEKVTFELSLGLDDKNKPMCLSNNFSFLPINFFKKVLGEVTKFNDMLCGISVNN